MDTPSLILTKLAERFPGLADGAEPVDGGDLVQFFGQYQEQLSAIAAKGTQAGRRKALPKHTYFAIGDVSYVDKHVVTDPHVAANKFLKRRKCAPTIIQLQDKHVIGVVGVCALSDVVILEGDDYLYRRNEEVVEEGEAIPKLEKVLRSAAEVALCERDDLKFYERAEIEGLAKDPANAKPSGQRYDSVEAMVRATADDPDDLLRRMATSKMPDTILEKMRDLFSEETVEKIREEWSTAIDDDDRGCIIWDATILVNANASPASNRTSPAANWKNGSATPTKKPKTKPRRCSSTLA